MKCCFFIHPHSKEVEQSASPDIEPPQKKQKCIKLRLNGTEVGNTKFSFKDPDDFFGRLISVCCILGVFFVSLPPWLVEED